jgi:hypothetical protein
MKKLIATMAAIAMTLTLSAAPAFADDPFDGVNVDYENNPIMGDTPTDGEAEGDVPVYGYVGPYAEAIDDNDEDPDTDETDKDTPPKFIYHVNVSVPTKLIWAAFQENDGDVQSPEYHIRNNGTKDLDVTMVSFEAKEDGGNVLPANLAIDKDLTLTVVSDDFDEQEVVSAGDPSASYDINNASLGTLEQGTANQWNFEFGGNYGGEFGDAKTPEYVMTLKFAVADEE